MQRLSFSVAHSGRERTVRYSDGVDRPDSYDGTSLSRGIERYFASAGDRELAALRIENAGLRARLAALNPKAKAAASS